MRSILAIAILVLVTSGCQRTIERFPVGDKLCVGERAISSRTEDYICKALSLSAHGMIDPDGLPVVSEVTYEDAYQIFRTYGSGHAQGIVFLNMADGTTRGLFIGCVVGPFGDPDNPSVAPEQCSLMRPMDGEHWSLPHEAP